MPVRVVAPARLHLGFVNLSPARERLYGGLGVAISDLRTVVSAEATGGTGVECTDPEARRYAERTLELLDWSDPSDLPGTIVRIEESLPRHVGLGSGTQLALAVLTAIGIAHQDAHYTSVDPRALAPQLGRGGRSGVGVAAFETGGFVLDVGHPTGQFTAEPPERGSWTVPPIAARHEIPDDWRFVVVLPDSDPGRSGTDEDDAMRRTVQNADPAVADEISRIIIHRVLPAIADGDADAFGAAIADVGRLNGAWYADAQGGVYRPPVGTIVEELSSDPAVAGAGQSSWGPATYAITTEERVSEAIDAAQRALAEAGVGGTVAVTQGRNRGANVEEDERKPR